MARNDLPWLVRSSGRILGPYPTDKVCEMLRARDISMLDEVSTPGRRYQTLQYIEEFRDVIDGLRKAVMSEHTEATWSQHTNLTQTLTDVDGATMTEELADSGFSVTGQAKEIVVNDVEEVATGPAPAGGGRYQAPQAQNSAIQRQVDKTTRGLWIVTALVLLLAAGYIVRRRMTPANEARGGSGGAKQSVLGLIQIGHYADALRELKSSLGDSSQANDLSIYYATLLVQVDGQTSLGRRLFNGILTARRPEMKQAYTGLGVADLMDGQTDQAAESLDRALALDAEYVPAILNLANVYLKRGNYEKAKDLAERALQQNPAQGEALLLLAEANLYTFKAAPNPGVLAGLTQRLRDARRRQWDYTAELGFYEIYFDHLLRDPTIADRLRDYLDRDPALTVDHRHNVFVYRGRFQWGVLARQCEQLAPQLGTSPRTSTFLASCFAHEGRWDAARAAIERAVHQDPRDPLTQAWYSYVLRESGDADQASVVLGRAAELDRRAEYQLPTLLQARFCQSAKITDCARTWWQKIYDRDLDSLPALGGLAWVHYTTGTRAEAQPFIAKGLKISPDYIPLLELRQRSEADGSSAAN